MAWISPAPPDLVGVPAQQDPRGDDQAQPTELAGGQQPVEPSQDRVVSLGQARGLDQALEYGHLVAQAWTRKRHQVNGCDKIFDTHQSIPEVSLALFSRGLHATLIALPIRAEITDRVHRRSHFRTSIPDRREPLPATVMISFALVETYRVPCLLGCPGTIRYQSSADGILPRRVAAISPAY
jgi:hypothetical protein